MSKKSNKEILTFFFENIIRSPDALQAICHPDCKLHWRGEPFINNFSELKSWLEQHGKCFPDLTFTIIDIITEGHKSAVRLIHSGTHLARWEGAEPTGKKFSIEEYMFFSIIDEKIQDFWVVLDTDLKKEQIGFLSIPPNKQ